MEGAETIKCKSELVDKKCDTYECIICKDVMEKPQYSLFHAVTELFGVSNTSINGLKTIVLDPIAPPQEL